MKSRKDFNPIRLENGRWKLKAVSSIKGYSHISIHSWASMQEAEAFRTANTSWPVRLTP